MKNKSILFIANFSDDTGYAWNNIYSLFQDLSIRFREYGITPLISFPEINGTNNNLFNNFEKKLLLNSELSNRNNVKTLLAYIKEHNIKYIYLTDQPSSQFSYRKLRQAGVEKIISHCRVSVANPSRPVPESITKQIAKFVSTRIPGRTVDKVICVSDFVRYRLEHKAKVPADRLVTVYNGVETAKFYSEPLAIETGEPVTLFTSGRATSHKGIKELIEAVAIVNQTCDVPFNVRYAGDGPDIESYKKRVKELGITNFSFLGQLPSVDKEIKQAHLLVMPSAWGDAFPSAVTESLASGRPLITTRAGGIPEIVGHEDNAYMVKPGDIEDLAKAITKALTNPEDWNAMAANARNFVADRFTLTNYYTNVWQEIKKEL